MHTLKCIAAAARPPTPPKFPPAGNLKLTPDSRLPGNLMRPPLGTTPASGVIRRAPASDRISAQSGSDSVIRLEIGNWSFSGCWTLGCWSFSLLTCHSSLLWFSRIFPDLCSFVSICGLKKYFWKNEGKLCPSLLSFFTKQSQTEPKANPKIRGSAAVSQTSRSNDKPPRHLKYAL